MFVSSTRLTTYIFFLYIIFGSISIGFKKMYSNYLNIYHKNEERELLMNVHDFMLVTKVIQPLERLEFDMLAVQYMSSTLDTLGRCCGYSDTGCTANNGPHPASRAKIMQLYSQVRECQEEDTNRLNTSLIRFQICYNKTFCLHLLSLNKLASETLWYYIILIVSHFSFLWFFVIHCIQFPQMPNYKEQFHWI